VRQKRPTIEAKETYYRDKRDLQKRPTIEAKETYLNKVIPVLIMITWQPGTTGRPREGRQGWWADAWR
jgi:hypothetical protein